MYVLQLFERLLRCPIHIAITFYLNGWIEYPTRRHPRRTRDCRVLGGILAASNPAPLLLDVEYWALNVE